ncbi:uncharacterized protein LOC121766879 [Salvia splendens]|uniref:uncharacterized protein LOC121766879 n=1 Tax=Salvia splendens TaxID=180675 RepID=UPI001C26787A|nr:uncharacterized protein LOC121766879 [Salvia splendens]
MGAMFDPRMKLKLVEYDPLSSEDKVNRLKMKFYILYNELKKKGVDASLSKDPQPVEVLFLKLGSLNSWKEINQEKLFCTIWESNVDLYLDQLKKSEGTIPIVIIQFCKRNLFRGEIRISTHFQASKVVINADVKEVKDFRMRIRDDSRFLQQGSVIEGGQRLGGEYDDLQVKSLEDLSCLEEGSCWVFGKIESVECHYGQRSG